MIGIINYGMGNILSVFHAFEMVGAEAKILNTPAEINEADKLVLPGVGAFRDCIGNLKKGGFVEPLNDAVNRQGKPILGICLGMQVMARRSFEYGEYEGLGWFEADVVRLTPADSALRIPQIGWNEVVQQQGANCLAGIPDKTDFYFVHSYHMQCDNPQDVVAVCDYGGEVTAIVQKGNIFATQFHPEKSQDHGLKLLENFMKWTS
jgi:glutamine amidotransferase